MALPTNYCMLREFSRTMLLREHCALGMTSPELVRSKTSLSSARLKGKPLRLQCTPLEDQVCELGFLVDII